MSFSFKLLLPIYCVIFFGYIGYSLIITIFTPMLLYHEGSLLSAATSESQRVLVLGLIIFLYPFGQFLSSPILGAFSDRFGRRPVLIFSLAVSIVTYAFIGVGIVLNSFWLVASSLLTAGLAEGNITIAQSTVADITPTAERSRLFGYIYISASLSYIVGPILGGIWIDLPVYSSLSFAIPFFVVSVFLFGIFWWLYLGFEETLKIHKRGAISFFEAFTNLKNLFIMRNLRFLFLTNFLLYFAIFGFFQSFPIYVVSVFKVDVWILALFIAWSSIPFVIINLWLTGRLAAKFSALQMTIFSSIWTGIFLEILLFPSHIEALWITTFLVGIGIAVCLPAMASHLSSCTNESEQGRVMGINQSLQFFAEASSGLAMGFLAAIFVKLALIIFGLFSLLAAFLLFQKKKRRKDFSLL